MKKYSICSECGEKIPLKDYMCDDCHARIRGYTRVVPPSSEQKVVKS